MNLFKLFKKFEVKQEVVKVEGLGNFLIKKYKGNKVATRNITNDMGDNFVLRFPILNGTVSKDQIDFYKGFEDNWDNFRLGIEEKTNKPAKVKSLIITANSDNRYDYICELETDSLIIVYERNM